jgi:hypothetical protein
MDTSTILAAGVSAVQSYVECAGAIAREDSIHERSLTAHLAMQLHRLSGLHAPTEVLYTRIIDDLGMAADPTTRILLELRSADIALYDDGKPIALVEAKILSDGKRALPQFFSDLQKGDPVKLSERLPIYAVALVCETTSRNVEQQQEWIKKASGDLRLQYSEPVPTCTGETWKWFFGCASRQPSEVR